MILFVNVFLSNSTQGLRYDRGLYGPTPDRVDVFRYALASLAPLAWTHVVIHYELGEDCRHRQRELDDDIRQHFDRPVIHHFQNQYQPQWQDAVRALEAVGDPLVWFCCNDDHVFVDASTELVDRIERACTELLDAEPFLSFVPTHWPEYMAAESVATVRAPDYFVFRGQVTNSMQVVPTALLRHWWFAHDYDGAWMPRSDAGTLMGGAIGSAIPAVGATTSRRPSVSPPPPYPVVVPRRELVRHFDGYSHAGIDINACPPLVIPDGFFSDGLRIETRAPHRDPGAVLVDPFANAYSSVDAAGADLKVTLDDLPLFWRTRIAAVDDGAAHEGGDARRARNLAVLIMATECAQVPAAAIQPALVFAPDDDVAAELAALDEAARAWRLQRHYREMSYRRTAEGVARTQATLQALILASPR